MVNLEQLQQPITPPSLPVIEKIVKGKSWPSYKVGFNKPESLFWYPIKYENRTLRPFKNKYLDPFNKVFKVIKYIILNPIKYYNNTFKVYYLNLKMERKIAKYLNGGV